MQDVLEVPKATIETNALTLAERAKAIKITNSDEYLEATELLKSVAALRWEVTAAFLPQIEAAHKAHKVALEQRKKFEAPLVEAETLLKRECGRFTSEAERLRLQEQEKLRKIAMQEAEDKAILEAQRLHAAGQVEAAEALVSRAVTPAPVIVAKSVPKVEGVSSRKTYKFRVVNESLIPREYLQVDEQKIGQVVRALKEMAKIPGVEVYAEESVAVRTS